MFRFTIRELLLLTLVVGLVAGLIVRERQTRDKLAEAARWKQGAEALEQAMTEVNWKVEWQRGAVWIERPGEEGAYYIFNNPPDIARGACWAAAGLVGQTWLVGQSHPFTVQRISLARRLHGMDRRAARLPFWQRSRLRGVDV